MLYNCESLQKQNHQICQKLTENDSNQISLTVVLEILLKKLKLLQNYGKNVDNENENFQLNAADKHSTDNLTTTDTNLEIHYQKQYKLLRMWRIKRERFHLLREQKLMEKIGKLNVQIAMLQDRLLNMDATRSDLICADLENELKIVRESFDYDEFDYPQFCFSDYRRKRRQKEYLIRVKKYYN